MKKYFFVLPILCLLPFFSLEAQGVSRSKLFNLDHGVALGGYDPVSYFVGPKALRGDKQYVFTDQGALYYFSSAANRDLFKTNPSKYEPQYGGWCAFAMGKDGTKVEVDPATFKILDGKLFLFYNRFFNNTLKSWEKDESRLHKSADKNWQKIIQ